MLSYIWSDCHDDHILPLAVNFQVSCPELDALVEAAMEVGQFTPLSPFWPFWLLWLHWLLWALWPLWHFIFISQSSWYIIECTFNYEISKGSWCLWQSDDRRWLRRLHCDFAQAGDQCDQWTWLSCGNIWPMWQYTWPSSGNMWPMQCDNIRDPPLTRRGQYD